MQERIKDLTVTPSQPQFSKPSTIIMVIGESASRDYMSAFTDYPVETTPWLSAKKTDEHLFYIQMHIPARQIPYAVWNVL